MSAISLSATWPQVWERAHAELLREGYRRNTRRLYRHCLRRFARHVRVSPDLVQERHLQDYLFCQARRGGTASWISANIGVLRKVFDKLGGRTLTRHLTTPRRPWPLPYVVTGGIVRQILAAAPTLRDQLLLGLLYGCGLKVGELCSLRWAHVQVTAASPGSPAFGLLSLAPTREIPIPADLLPVLTEGLARCPRTDFVFPGARAGRPISERMVALILRQAVRAAGVQGPIDGMVLRHSYAVHSLEAGLTIRELQLRLGHRQLTTTLIYLRAMQPKVASPLDTLPVEVTPPPAATVPMQPEPTAPPRLFPAPLTTERFTLPFAAEPTGVVESAKAFYVRLRTRVVGGFLALRRVVWPTS